MAYGDWYLQNAPRTVWGRWMQGAPDALEGGIDVPLDPGTPVYALGTGTLQGYGNFWHPNGNPGYGVLTERTNVPGLGASDVYYQHMQLANNFTPCINGNCGGQIVTRGQLIGWVHHPDPGEVEVGINPKWSGVWGNGQARPGPWITDPRPYLQALASGSGGAVIDNTGTTGTSMNPLDPAFWTGLTEHIFVFLIALVLVAVGFIVISRPAVEQGSGVVEKGAFL